MKNQASFYFLQFLLLIIFALFLVFVYPKTGLDASLIAPYFSEKIPHFPLKHQPFLAQFMHTDLKVCMVLIALASLLMALRATYIQTNGHAASRASFISRLKILVKNNYFLAFIGMLFSTALVSYLKSISIYGCPHNLSLYGGELPLMGLFDHLPAGIQAGHCFPGGHASGGFALMAFYFAFRVEKPVFAKTMLALGLLLGFAMGWAQMMRGEHFLSHNLWTACVVWAVLLILSLAVQMLGLNSQQRLS
jgi:membrane-associated PAP2 superfamily phosphatase